MEVYTGKQLADILQQEDADMNLRTVRYYTQIGMLPPLELVGNKRVYTGRHLEYLRAILTLSKSGESLADIQVKLAALSPEEIAGLGARLRFYQPQHILQHETLVINDDVMLTVSPQITPEQRSEMIEAVTRLLRGENKL
ncbi:MerR family transcriptional regulator [Paenibacillus riograndensis]|uniref:MerR family transcriptional regulator n=1 Tax=Paenibacillus riograndensis TaxID=483937 RepID=A0A132U291_9BACL|nr:MerR family transcriptional regulator [Paenibacillus riograndensis]KWX77688.1 MerR family transcriptional regulator [Paenibacillus riograndensis]KWX89164.1 MerR family transcriptional regulator [Paenibacillus riograndensis]